MTPPIVVKLAEPSQVDRDNIARDFVHLKTRTSTLHPQLKTCDCDDLITMPSIRWCIVRHTRIEYSNFLHRSRSRLPLPLLMSPSIVSNFETTKQMSRLARGLIYWLVIKR